MVIILAEGKLRVINVNKMVSEMHLIYVKVQFKQQMQIFQEAKEIKKKKSTVVDK